MGRLFSNTSSSSSQQLSNQPPPSFQEQQHFNISSSIFLGTKFLSGISYVESKILKLLATLEGLNYDWETNEDDKEEEPSEYGQAMNELGRLVTDMGGLVLDILSPSNSSSEIWQSSRSAVTLFSIVAKKGSESLEPKLMVLVAPLLRFVKHTDPNVRRKAIIAIQDSSKRFNPEFQNLYHADVVPGLTAIMRDFLNPKIQVEAVRAMLYFAENCTSNISAPYLDELISTLLRCLQRGDSDMQELVLEAIASIASSSQQRVMGKHYGRVMVHINMMMGDVKMRQNRKLLAAMIECITKLWKAVGKEKFKDDTGKVLELLASYELGLKPDNLRKTVLQAWGTICTCLGKNFLPWTTVVIPHLLESARLDPDMSIPEDPDNEESHESYEKKVSCKLMEEKAKACTVLGIFAAELKEEFASWVPKVVDILVPLFGIDHPQVVRDAALKAVKPVLESYKVAEEKGVGVYEWYQNSRYQELFSRVKSAKQKASDDSYNRMKAKGVVVHDIGALVTEAQDELGPNLISRIGEEFGLEDFQADE